jgi:iron-sulfur cluster insertion protein
MMMRSDFLTHSALAHIKSLLKSKPQGSFFRVSVDAGGCNGFQYVFKIDDTLKEEDSLFEQEGATIAVDSVSQPFLEKAQIDFVEDLMGSYFKVNNPEAESSCGCGNSFSV